MIRSNSADLERTKQALLEQGYVIHQGVQRVYCGPARNTRIIGELENKFENLSLLLGNMAHERMGVSGNPLYGLPQEPSFPLSAQEESHIVEKSKQ